MWYLAKFIYSVFNCICIKFKWETMHIFSILGVKVITFLKGKNPHDLS